jgi:hypothetical protein
MDTQLRTGGGEEEFVFCTIGPRGRNRSSFKMRLRWAKSISIFFRSHLDLV